MQDVEGCKRSDPRYWGKIATTLRFPTLRSGRALCAGQRGSQWQTRNSSQWPYASIPSRPQCTWSFQVWGAQSVSGVLRFQIIGLEIAAPW